MSATTTERVNPADHATNAAKDERDAISDANAGGGSTRGKKPSLRAMIALTTYLTVLALGLLGYTHQVVHQANEEASGEISVGWEIPPGVTLNVGPVEFHYDSMEKKLVHYGTMTAERKLELRALYEGPVGRDTLSIIDSERVRRSYFNAIDNLFFVSGLRQGNMFRLFLMLGALGGTLGSVLRSLVEFVGSACYKGELDLRRWWPLYVTRPIVGAVIGFTLVILFKAQLLTLRDLPTNDTSFWWLGVAIIGGYSTGTLESIARWSARSNL